MSEWLDIESAPKDGTFVRLRSEKYAPDALFWWEKESDRWETILFAVARTVDGWWSEDVEQPTHWKPAA